VVVSVLLCAVKGEKNKERERERKKMCVCHPQFIFCIVCVCLNGGEAIGVFFRLIRGVCERVCESLCVGVMRKEDEEEEREKAIQIVTRNFSKLFPSLALTHSIDSHTITKSDHANNHALQRTHAFSETSIT
jgi:hypothetical protein